MENHAPEGVHSWLVFFKAMHAVSKLIQADLQGTELGESDFRVLEVLLHKGAQPVNALGPKVNLTPGSISVAVDRLHRRGFVSRVEDLGDRRVRIVDLTAEGRRMILPYFQRRAATLEQVFEVLTPEERIQLEQMLKRVGRNAETLGGADQSTSFWK
jgi:MarR family transcriptional regulator, 2-MHQ and catechol-resistance regulon repressor